MRRQALFLALTLAAAGCGGSPGHQAQPPAPKPAAKPAAPAPPTCDSAALVPAAVGSKTLVAVVHTRVVAYRRPNGKPFKRFAYKNVNGAPTVFEVEAVQKTRDCKPAWY